MYSVDVCSPKFILLCWRRQWNIVLIGMRNAAVILCGKKTAYSFCFKYWIVSVQMWSWWLMKLQRIMWWQQYLIVGICQHIILHLMRIWFILSINVVKSNSVEFECVANVVCFLQTWIRLQIFSDVIQHELAWDIQHEKVVSLDVHKRLACVIVFSRN